MKTITTQYISLEDLKRFIKQHNIQQEKNILLQIFTGVCEINFIEELVSNIKKIIPDIKIIGSTTSGEIMDGLAQTNSTVLSFSIFKQTTIKTYFCKYTKTSYETAKTLIDKFDKDKKAKVAITFADGLHINGEEYINALDDYDKNLVVAGGLAGDNSKFIQTIVFNEEKVLSQGVVAALLFNEDLQIITNASFGWENIGKTMTITKASANIVYTIDEQKAVDIYEKYLGKDIAEKLPEIGIEFPLIKKSDLNIPRAVVGKNDDGSLIFAGNLKTGDKVTFGYGNIQAILNYVHKIGKSIKDSESIFIYSCMARLKLLNESVNNEFAPLQKITSVSGFFTYGEFYSNTKILEHELLNQTMTILSLSENTETKKDSQDTKKPPISEDRRKTSLTLKALSHLIAQTSKELEDINNSLEEKVKQEVDKNRQKDQAMLHQSKLAQMGEMISMIAHQWRQPLTAINSISLGINLKATLGTLDTETLLKLTEDISNHSKHLSTTIDDFRDFFKPKKEQKDTDFNEIIKSVLKIIEVSINTKNIQIIKELECTQTFKSYPNEIKQVLLNLLKNAEDALMEREIEDAYIKIKTYTSQTSYILEISDNAGGIPNDIIDKVFEPYFSTKTKKDGTGLGLYMSKTIIEEHCHGKLDVSNDKNGAVFKIEITREETD
jgi:hypothetical protein